MPVTFNVHQFATDSQSMHAPDLPLLPKNAPIPFELAAAHEGELQAFFEANPDYFLAVQGAPAGPQAAYDEIHGDLPAGWSYTKKWLIGYRDPANGKLVAFASLVSDLLADTVWHIGLFVVATELHGSGLAASMFHSIEAWAKAHGARWLRLGVVVGNQRAERFWGRQGFAQVRMRKGVEMGERSNSVRVMVKPLAEHNLSDYLKLVPRDDPARD
ncbi:GNAT family N-acetyltransferase [Niveibacterium sp.]|uniref:GNAT family N-acetyltransferase n=1 Tax=Niveibacterium sp. TaxID=2017444 RepID=UPI0035B2D323